MAVETAGEAVYRGCMQQSGAVLTSSVVAVSNTATELTVGFDDGVIVRCNRFWLRDNCPSDGDRASLFRSFSVDALSEDLAIIGGTIEGDRVRIAFDDGTTDEFDPAWLRRYAISGVEPDACVPWRAGFEPESFGFDELLHESRRHHDLLESVARSGVALVTGLSDQAATEQLASLLGPIRETDFGRVFDIVSEPQPFTPSQSTMALDPHTDDPYRYTPAGASILHCVTPSSGCGGESVVVDGFAVAAALRRNDPAAFDVLSTVNVPFVHRRHDAVEQGGDVHLRAEAPIIAVDAGGRVCGIRFHERSMATMTLDPDLAERFYLALMRFCRAVRGDEFAWRRQLAVGEALVYDNQRVLHGRTGFEGAQTRRHLRLCTIDRDQVHSRLRRLRERYAPGTECAPLPAGNLS